MHRLCLALCALLSTPSVHASGSYWLQIDRLIDRPGQAPRVDVTLVVRDGKVAEVDDGFKTPPDDTTVHNLRRYTVLPGLIDSHVHLTSDRGGIEDQFARVTDDVADHAFEAQRNAR